MERKILVNLIKRQIKLHSLTIDH